MGSVCIKLQAAAAIVPRWAHESSVPVVQSLVTVDKTTGLETSTETAQCNTNQESPLESTGTFL